MTLFAIRCSRFAVRGLRFARSTLLGTSRSVVEGRDSSPEISKSDIDNQQSIGNQQSAIHLVLVPLSTVCPSVMALKTIVRMQHTIIVTNTPLQPQWSAIQPTPVPAMADPKT